GLRCKSLSPQSWFEKSLPAFATSSGSDFTLSLFALAIMACVYVSKSTSPKTTRATPPTISKRCCTSFSDISGKINRRHSISSSSLHGAMQNSSDFLIFKNSSVRPI
ncbi:unnamed protein product, partial [Ectocarpus sp. 8 AP-2014]